MKLSKLLDNLLEMGMGGGAATTSAGVVGIPKPVGATVSREYSGYDENRRKKKKKKDKWTHPTNWYKSWTHHNSPMHKGTPMHEDDAKGEAVNSSDKKYSDDGNATKLGRLAFKGDRPRYRPKKTFITRKPPKPKAIKEDEWLPLQQRTPAMDLEWLRKGFEGDRPGYKMKKQKLTKKKGDLRKKPVPVEEQFMGPQLFYDASPYHDLEFLVKFWRGSKKGDIARPEGTPKKLKKLKERPIGTYGTSMPTSKAT